MGILDCYIPSRTLDYLKSEIDFNRPYNALNELIYNEFGIVEFFRNSLDVVELKRAIFEFSENEVNESRAEYGDFQTNESLAKRVVNVLASKNILPKVIIEPTCGKGNIILSALDVFKGAVAVYGIEIYKPYVWECKFKIIEYYLKRTRASKPDIHIIHGNVFDYDFNKIADQTKENEVLIIGNPPWVNNAKLGSLNSDNLPKKSNFKEIKGIDAITGKGNFDIAESIILNLISLFHGHNGRMALLIKKSVGKNIIYDQKKNKFEIAEIENFSIDSKAEFEVSVEASLFSLQFNRPATFVCKELDIYEIQDNINNEESIDSKDLNCFGWFENKFVSDIRLYKKAGVIDGVCSIVWRQGVKHDCSSVMEFTIKEANYVNGLNEEFILEKDLVYGIIKSSDLKEDIVNRSRKYTIITQRKVGQDTNYIKIKYPKTFNYLDRNFSFFQKRKSSIYKNKPPFSIFGIGDYSFKPYKVAISGLYKSFKFSLVVPELEKPLMLDDTCYFIGFDKIEHAVYTLLLLNSEIVIQFLKSITFIDAKRTFTKDVLMRIDIYKVSKEVNLESFQEKLDEFNLKHGFNLDLGSWDEYINLLQPVKNQQLELF